MFGETVRLMRERMGPIEVVVPTTNISRRSLGDLDGRQNGRCSRGLFGHAEKRAAFRVARAALAKSGTVTLEVAVAGVPMVAAYKVSPVEACHPAAGPRAVLHPRQSRAGQNVVPEIVQEDCTPERLADALVPLFGDTPERRRQIDAFAPLDAIMEIGSRAPAARAADIVLGAAQAAQLAGARCACSPERMQTPALTLSAGGRCDSGAGAIANWSAGRME